MAAGPANAKLSNIRKGMISCEGSMYGMLSVLSWQLKPERTGLKTSVSSRKYRLTIEEASIGS